MSEEEREALWTRKGELQVQQAISKMELWYSFHSTHPFTIRIPLHHFVSYLNIFPTRSACTFHPPLIYDAHAFRMIVIRIALRVLGRASSIKFCIVMMIHTAQKDPWCSSFL